MASQGRLSSILGPFRLIWLSIHFHYEALKEALRNDGLAALAHPQRIRTTAVANLFSKTSDGFIAYENTTCVNSLVSPSRGRILEIGTGPGNQLQRFDPSLVEFIYGVDPNPHFVDVVGPKLKKLGLQDKYKLLTCGIEDSDILRSEGITEGSMDTILSIQVMCSVPDPKSAMKEVWKLLKPGGSFVFWEHVRNKDTATAIAQAAWNPAWSALVGCCLNRDILEDILAAGEWENPDSIEVEKDPYSCLPRISGVLKKKA